MANAGGIRAGGAFVEIFAKDGAFHQAMTRVENRLRATGRAMQAVGTSMAMGAGMIGLPMAMAVRTFASFDDAIRATAAVTGSFGAEGAASFQLLSNAAQELASTTGYTAIEVANLMTELGRAGFDTTQIIAMTGAVLDMARASGTDATVSAGIMAAAIAQFGLDATDAARVADVLTHAANATFNSVTDLGEALKYAGPVAAQLGMSLEDTVAILGTLGNVGIQGSMAGTTLRRLSVITAAEGKKLQEIFGVAFIDAAGNARPLVEVLGEIAAATNNLPTAQRTAMFAQAFGLLGITGAQAIGAVAADTRKLADELKNAEGVARTTAREMNAGIGGAARLLKTAIEGLALAFGEALAPALQWLAMATTKLTELLRGFIKAFPVVAQVIAGTTGAVFALGVAAIVGGYALQVMASGAMVAGKALMFLLSPVGLVTAAIVGGIALILTAAYQLSPAFRTEADAIMAALMRLDFAAAWEVMNLNLAIALVQLHKQFANAWAAVTNGAAAAGDAIRDGLFYGMGAAYIAIKKGVAGITMAIDLLKTEMGLISNQEFVRRTKPIMDEIDALEAANNGDARATRRQAAADARQAENDARNAGFDAVIDDLRQRLDDARENATSPPEKTKAPEPAKAAKPGAPATAPATPAAKPTPERSARGETLGTFADSLGSRLGAGPQLEPARETAANTAELVDLTHGIAGTLEGLANQGLGNQEGVAAGLPGALPSPTPPGGTSTTQEILDAMQNPADAVRNAAQPPTPATPTPAEIGAATAAAMPAPMPAQAVQRAGDQTVAAIDRLAGIATNQLAELKAIVAGLQNITPPAFA